MRYDGLVVIIMTKYLLLKPRGRMEKKSFTLAEVVIVLGIIGLIAEMTIPALISNVQDAKLKGMWKKAYSSINQATIQIKEDNGGSLVGLFTDANTMVDVYASKMRVLEVCHYNNDFQGNCHGYYASIWLSDGVILGTNYSDTNCDTDSWGLANFGQNLCGEFYVEANENSNVEGGEVFWVGIGPEKVIPGGSAGMINPPWKCPVGVFCNSYKYLYE